MEGDAVAASGPESVLLLERHGATVPAVAHGNGLDQPFVAGHPVPWQPRRTRGAEHDLLLQVEQAVPFSREVRGQPRHMAVGVRSRLQAEAAGQGVLHGF